MAVHVGPVLKIYFPFGNWNKHGKRRIPNYKRDLGKIQSLNNTQKRQGTAGYSKMMMMIQLYIMGTVKRLGTLFLQALSVMGPGAAHTAVIRPNSN